MGAKKLNRICEFSGCGRKHSVRGLCITHHSQREQGRELSPIGTVPRIKGRDCSLLTMEQVLKKLDEGCTQMQVSRELRMPQNTVSKIKIHGRKRIEKLKQREEPCVFPDCEGRRLGFQDLCEYHYVQRMRGGPLTPNKGYRKLSREDVQEIQRLLDAKYVQRAIAAHFNVHPSTITHIKKGRRTGKNTGPRKGKLQRS